MTEVKLTCVASITIDIDAMRKQRETMLKVIDEFQFYNEPDMVSDMEQMVLMLDHVIEVAEGVNDG